MKGFKILTAEQLRRFVGNGKPGWRRSPWTGLPVRVTEIREITNEQDRDNHI